MEPTTILCEYQIYCYYNEINIHFWKMKMGVRTNGSIVWFADFSKPYFLLLILFCSGGMFSTVLPSKLTTTRIVVSYRRWRCNYIHFEIIFNQEHRLGFDCSGSNVQIHFPHDKWLLVECLCSDILQFYMGCAWMYWLYVTKHTICGMLLRILMK